MKPLPFLLSILILFCAVNGMPTMAVLPMTSDDADIEHTSWTKRIEAECVKYKLYTMVDRVDIENVFKEQAMQQTGAFSEESMSKFGSLLGADYVLVSTLHTQKENTLDLKIISVSTGEISHFVQWSASSSARELYRHGIESAIEVLLTDKDIKKGTADHRKERIGRISKKIISATMLAAGIGTGIWAVSNTSSAMNASNRYNETGNAEYKTAYDDARDKATYGYIACGVSLPLSVLFFLWK